MKFTLLHSLRKCIHINGILLHERYNKENQRASRESSINNYQRTVRKFGTLSGKLQNNHINRFNTRSAGNQTFS